jgi:hypothetical protein
MHDYVRFDFLAAVTLKIAVFWVVTPCSLNFTNVSEEPAASQQMEEAGFSEMLVLF